MPVDGSDRRSSVGADSESAELSLAAVAVVAEEPVVAVAAPERGCWRQHPGSAQRKTIQGFLAECAIFSA